MINMLFAMNVLLAFVSTLLALFVRSLFRLKRFLGLRKNLCFVVRSALILKLLIGRVIRIAV